jgi:hypothetical protein
MESRVIWDQTTEVRFQRETEELKLVQVKKSTLETLQMKTTTNVLNPNRTNPKLKNLKKAAWVVLVLCLLELGMKFLTTNSKQEKVISENYMMLRT